MIIGFTAGPDYRRQQSLTRLYGVVFYDSLYVTPVIRLKVNDTTRQMRQPSR